MKNVYSATYGRKGFLEKASGEWYANSPTMVRIMRAMNRREDIGDYGRLVYVMTARHFISDQEMAEMLATQPGIGYLEAEGMVQVIKAHDYSPPSQDQISEWQSYQRFQIDPEDEGDLYEELDFPDYIMKRMEKNNQNRIAEHA